MRSLRIFLMGTAAGVALSLLNLILTYAGQLVLVGQPGLPLALVVSGVAVGIIAGGAGMALSRLTVGGERVLLVLLISAAVASVAVYSGGYGNGSRIPVAIYGLALLNGLLIAAATARLCARHGLNEEPYM